jgi:hypothetical protein
MYAVVGHQYFSGLRLAILDKFGEPADRAVTTVSNSMGTEFVAARHRWTVGTQVLRLDDYSPNLTQTTLTVYDETRLREAEAAVTPRR